MIGVCLLDILCAGAEQELVDDGEVGNEQRFGAEPQRSVVAVLWSAGQLC